MWIISCCVYVMLVVSMLGARVAMFGLPKHGPAISRLSAAAPPVLYLRVTANAPSFLFIK